MNSVSVGRPKALDCCGVCAEKFVQFRSAMVAMLALPPRYVGAVMKTLAQTVKPVLVRLEFQDHAIDR